ncbi:MAG: hypothetical protein QOJ00_2481 [Actinomycetota bacterium]
MRLADDERQKVIAELQRHCGAGSLTLDEFADRAGMVWAAATSMDLDAVVADLPALTTSQELEPPMVGAARRRKMSRWVVAIMSGSNKKGRWRVGDQLTSVSIMGGAEIDLREAEFDGPELHIVAVAIMGGVSIIVPEGIDVDLGGIAFMGGKECRLAAVPIVQGAPRIRVTAFALMGGVDVRSRKSPAELAAARSAKRIADRERRELRRAERSDRNRGRGRDKPARRGPELAGPARNDHWQTTDDDAAAVRRRLKRNGRPEGTVTIMFTDIVGSTELTQRLGDENASLLVKEHNELVRAQVAAHGGYEVKFRGDGFMLAFTSAARGVRCAIAVQQEMQAFAQRHPECPMKMRVGINAGEAVPEGNDFLGTAVNIAARLTDTAEGDDILVTSVVRDLVTSTGEFQFAPEQQIALKGLSDAQRACLVEW